MSSLTTTCRLLREEIKHKIEDAKVEKGQREKKGRKGEKKKQRQGPDPRSSLGCLRPLGKCSVMAQEKLEFVVL